MVNLVKQIENARFFGVHAVVAVNRFPYVFIEKVMSVLLDNFPCSMALDFVLTKLFML